ncbi:sugar phosphate nucleotidyltransferase, partial [Gammaproteobacteria bacterium]|nr:sugar phosphate nucleotidyltransferase [Gammaproteobacteria bacterium]
EEKLIHSGKKDFVKKINRDIFKEIKFTYVRQKTQNGLGDAILHAEHLIQEEPFAIILADDLIINNPSCISQLIETYKEHQCSVIGVNEVPENEIEKYGVISIDKSISINNTFFLKDIVEKPKTNAPSNLAVVGRYVLSSKIFKYLNNLAPSVGGEVQLTDAIKLMLDDEKVVGHMYEGKHFDCGSRHGYVNAIKYLAKDMFNE